MPKFKVSYIFATFSFFPAHFSPLSNMSATQEIQSIVLTIYSLFPLSTSLPLLLSNLDLIAYH